MSGKATVKTKKELLQRSNNPFFLFSYDERGSNQEYPQHCGSCCHASPASRFLTFNSVMTNTNEPVMR